MSESLFPELQKAYRLRCSCRVFLRFQQARREPPMVLEYLCPLPKPLDFFPADVKPLISLCLCTALQIQLILGSLRIALCAGSTRMTS